MFNTITEKVGQNLNTAISCLTLLTVFWTEDHNNTNTSTTIIIQANIILCKHSKHATFYTITIVAWTNVYRFMLWQNYYNDYCFLLTKFILPSNQSNCQLWSWRPAPIISLRLLKSLRYGKGNTHYMIWVAWPPTQAYAPLYEKMLDFINV